MLIGWISQNSIHGVFLYLSVPQIKYQIGFEFKMNFDLR